MTERSVIGKTVSRVEPSPTDPEYGSREEDRVLVHFTDGTALEVHGSSYDEVSQAVRLLDRADVIRMAHAAQGRRERERVERLTHEEWRSVSQDERDRRRAAARARTSPSLAAVDDILRNLARRWGADALVSWPDD